MMLSVALFGVAVLLALAVLALLTVAWHETSVTAAALLAGAALVTWLLASFARNR